MSEAGYAPDRVFRYLVEHGRRRSHDGRPMRLNGHSLPESHRNTLANWEERKIARIPLGRWDAILLEARVHLYEYEMWEEETYGDLSFTADVLPFLE